MNEKISWVCLVIFLVSSVITTNYYLNKNKEKDINASREEQNIVDIDEIKENNSHTDSVASSKVTQVTSSNFDEVVLNNEKKVLIDFYADWCGPCKALSPIIDEVSEETDNVVFVRINVDDEPKLSDKYGVQSIPTLVLIKNDTEIDRSIGYIEKETLVKFINNDI